jgi:hypothetical protein
MMKTRIVHAGFSSEDAALRARDNLIQAGFADDQVCAFTRSATPVQVAEAAASSTTDSTEAADAGNGAINGAVGGTAVGIALGVVSSPFVGPLGVVTGGALGAYVGSLVGALNQLENTPEAEDNALQRWPWQVAVATPSPLQQCAAIDRLIADGGLDLHDAEGQLVAGTWIDFNPADHFRALDSQAIAALRERSAQSM